MGVPPWGSVFKISICQTIKRRKTYIISMAVHNILVFILTLVSIPFFFIGFIGNVLVIRIVHKTRDMHTTTNYLLANLAISDVNAVLLGPLFLFSHQVGYLSGGFGKFACKFTVLSDVAITVSSFTLTALAVERYHALLKPFRTGLRLGEDNIKKAIAFIWIASVLFCLPFFYFENWSEADSTCTGSWSWRRSQASKHFAIIFSVFSTYIPMSVFLYCYGSLIKGLYFTNTICSAESIEDRSDKKKVVTTFILASTGFVIGYAPAIIFYTVLAAGGGIRIDFKFYYDLSSIFLFLFYFSLCLNPILYAFP